MLSSPKKKKKKKLWPPSIVIELSQTWKEHHTCDNMWHPEPQEQHFKVIDCGQYTFSLESNSVSEADEIFIEGTQQMLLPSFYTALPPPRLLFSLPLFPH